MKVRAKRTYHNLDGIFKAGDILTLEFQRYEQDHIIHNALYGQKWNGQIVLRPSITIINPSELPKGVWKFCDELIAPKGSIKSPPHSYVLITKDGRRYPESTIIGAVGYKSLGELFDKV